MTILQIVNWVNLENFFQKSEECIEVEQSFTELEASCMREMKNLVQKITRISKTCTKTEESNTEIEESTEESCTKESCTEKTKLSSTKTKEPSRETEGSKHLH